MWEATRARIAREGFGARLLALQDPDGQWAGGAYFPGDFDFHGPETADGAGQPWTATTWTLNTLRDWGLDAAALGDTADLLAANSRWEYDDLPYWGGEVDCCINAYTLANGAWLGADVAGLAQWFLDHRLADGGWNCEWVEGSTRRAARRAVQVAHVLRHTRTCVVGSVDPPRSRLGHQPHEQLTLLRGKPTPRRALRGGGIAKQSVVLFAPRDG